MTRPASPATTLLVGLGDPPAQTFGIEHQTGRAEAARFAPDSRTVGGQPVVIGCGYCPPSTSHSTS
jgi:hypothetical protein